uniref:C2H2-type domain-containing protein n=1 Tax=Stegastes partitus TaxID=144197 RepID=A0A3B4ZNQ3_9TELE
MHIVSYHQVLQLSYTLEKNPKNCLIAVSVIQVCGIHLKPFKCSVCLSGFSSKKTMVRHIKKHSEDKSSFYQCQFCDSYFCHKSEFIIHTRIHKGKSPELIIQFEAGTAQKPYKCPCCTKCFSLTKTLIRHIKIHTEDKPYQCQFCGRNFCQKSDLGRGEKNL